MASGLSFLTAHERNSTQTKFVGRKPMRREPSGPGVHDLMGERIRNEIGILEPGLIQIHPMGTAEPGKTFLSRLWGWSRVNARDVYVPILLVEFKAKLGEIDGAAIDRKTYMAETITLREGVSDPAFVAVCSPGDGVQAHLTVHCQGSRYLDFEWGRNGSPGALTTNALWKPIL